MLMHDDLFAFVRAGSNSSMIWHVGDPPKEAYFVELLFDEEIVENSAKLFALLGGIM
jgi:hypothetical protein